MRLVFWLILLANVAFFYWHVSRPPAAEPPLIVEEPLAPGVKPLVLLRERGLSSTPGPTARPKARPATVAKAPTAAPSKPPVVAPPAPVEPAPSAPAKPPAVVFACFTLGPFGDADSARAVNETLQPMGVQTELREQTRRSVTGYWVYLPPSPSYTAAKRKVAALRKQGIDDMYIMGKGKLKNAISLGIFKRKSTATDRFNEVRRLASEVVMTPRYRERKEYWLDLRVDSSKTDTVAAIAVVAEELPKVKLSQRDRCE